MAEEWRGMDEKAKEAYDKMAEAEKSRYLDEMKAYEVKKKGGKEEKPKESVKKDEGKVSAKKAPES